MEVDTVGLDTGWEERAPPMEPKKPGTTSAISRKMACWILKRTRRFSWRLRLMLASAKNAMRPANGTLL